jgi:hypothetical protein
VLPKSRIAFTALLVAPPASTTMRRIDR